METDCECPICMEIIVSEKNIIITECGHRFHCKCMMLNIEHNGFGCPYCRQQMIEPKIMDDDDEEVSTVVSSTVDDDDEEEEVSIDEDEQEEAYILRGMRWLLSRAEGEEINEPEEEQLEEEENDNFVDDDAELLPSSSLVTQYLTERGVTCEELVKCILLNDRRYYNCDNHYNEYIRTSNKINGKINSVIHRYKNYNNVVQLPILEDDIE
jgi:hypothetical protein